MGNFISYELLPIVFNMSMTASVVVVFVLMARLLLKRAPKIFSYALWAVVLFRLLCPVSITTDFSLLGLFDAPVTETTTHTTAVEYIPQDVVHTPAPEVKLPVPGVNQSVNEALPQGDEQTAADPLEAPVALATLVWLAGIGVLAAYSVVSLLRLRQRLVGAVPLRENIYLADYIESPFVMGVLRPKIYLPSSMSTQEQAYIILHEQHHIRRGDHIIKALAFLALCVHWFNPLAWVAFVLSAKDMEMSCDEAVVRKLGESIRADYSASLLSLATGRRIIAGTPLAFGEGDTKSRIKNLLNWKRAKPAVVFLALALVVLVAAVCGTNAREPDGTWARGGTGADSGSFTYRFSENVHSYAICQEVYHRGDLVSPTSLMMFDNMEELGGVTRHQGTFALELQTSGQDLAGSALVIQHDGTTATFNRLLAVDFPECDALAWCWREGKTELPDDGSVIIGVVYYDDGQESYTWDCEALEEQGISETLKGNEWTVVLRLVVSTGDADQLAVSLGTIGRAQDLYDLRVSSMKDYTGIRALASVLGVDELGVYSIVNYEQVVEFAFEAPLSEQQETEMWKSATVLLALIEDTDQVNYSFPSADGSKRFTYYCGLEQPDSWAQNIGYDEIKAMGGSVQGIQELLEFIGLQGATAPETVGQHGTVEPLSAEELAWFNDWFEPIVQDKQGNDIGVNVRCCFLTSYYDDVTELNFEEFMRYFPGDGSRTSEAEFEALREVDGWPFDWVESLEKMPVPVHKFPKRLVDLILGEYAGISTEDLDTSAVAYLPEYDAYYNYTSDFGPGMFVSSRGERDGDTIRLYSVNGTGLLTLRQVDDTSYQIVSLQRLESPAS